MLKILYTIEKCAPRHQQGATHNLESTRVYNFLFLYNAVVYNPSLCVSFEAAKSDCYTRFIMPACRDRIKGAKFLLYLLDSLGILPHAEYLVPVADQAGVIKDPCINNSCIMLV